MRCKPLLRYPGSKDKLVNQLIRAFPATLKNPMLVGPLWRARAYRTYCEPFVGSGAMAVRMLGWLDPSVRVVFGDLDAWMVSLWVAVRDEPQELCREIDLITPSVELFRQFKAEDGSRIDPTLAGARKIALHQMSFSGFGFKSGSPLGGWVQGRSDYDIKCRWNPSAVKENIMRIHRLLRMFKTPLEIRNRDFADVLSALRQGDFAYLDPPYFKKGDQLYKHGMRPEDHQRLARLLRTAPFDWVLSYDDAPDVRALYDGWTRIEAIHVRYSNAVVEANERRPKNSEIAIAPLRRASQLRVA